jgi:hypothetical protein
MPTGTRLERCVTYGLNIREVDDSDRVFQQLLARFDDPYRHVFSGDDDAIAAALEVSRRVDAHSKP